MIRDLWPLIVGLGLLMFIIYKGATSDRFRRHERYEELAVEYLEKVNAGKLKAGHFPPPYIHRHR